MAPRIGDGSAAERNKTPIARALLSWLVPGARVLEIGAGNAVHARYFTALRPDLVWQTSETPDNLDTLRAAFDDTASAGLPAPIGLDVRNAWPAMDFDVIYGANIAHIMTSEAVDRLFAVAGTRLAANGHLCLYGPFIEPDQPLGAGNRRFDQALRQQHADMGLRSRDTLDPLAAAAGLALGARYVMPSDNRLLIWSRL